MLSQVDKDALIVSLHRQIEAYDKESSIMERVAIKKVIDDLKKELRAHRCYI